MKSKLRRFVSILALPVFILTGCATKPPYTGQGPYPQISRGARVPPIDFLGNVLALPSKLILWNWKFSNHSISAVTEEKLVEYLEYRKQNMLEDTRFRLNEYSPVADLKALWNNHHVGWPYRLILGTITTLLYDVLLPGRLFPWGDYYNPFTNTAHLYSDDIAIALHEAGHAHDFANYPYKGLYALLRIVPFMDLYQEKCATEEAIRYLEMTHKEEEELRSYKVLFPAYGTYVGSYIPVGFGSVIGAVVGHVTGRLKSNDKREYYRDIHNVLETPENTIKQIEKDHAKAASISMPAASQKIN